MNIKSWVWQAVLPLLLASSVTAEKDMTCTTSEVNLLQNPSFESGTLSGWKSVENSMSLVSGSNAAEGDCHLERSSRHKSPISGIYQPVSGMVEGSTYTVSAQWRIQKPVADGRASCDLAFYMVGDKSTTYIGGYEHLRATHKNTAWTTVSAQFTAKSASATFYVYLFCPVVGRHQAKADLDNIKILTGEKTTSCITASTLPTSTPVVSPSALPSPNSPSGNTAIPSQTSPIQHSSVPAAASSSSLTSSYSANPVSSSSISTSSSLTRVTISSRPHPSSRPTLRPIRSSSVLISSSISVPAEQTPSITVSRPVETGPAGTPTGPSGGQTSTPGNGSGNGSDGGNESGNGAGNGSDSGSGGSSDNNSGSENGSGNNSGGESGSGNGNGSNSGNGSGEGSNSGSGNGSDSGNGSGSGSGGSGSGNEGSGSQTESSASVGITTPAPTAPQLTTSTVFTTRTSTITACAATVTDCPARSTYVTTETILVSTTICPVEATTTANPGGSIITGSPVAPGNGGGHQYTTETFFSTRTVTVTACPSTVTNCPARDKTTSVATETVVAGTTVYEVTPTAVSPIQTGGAGEKPAPGQNGNDNVPGPKVTDIATVNPNHPVDVVYVTHTRVVSVLACPVKRDILSL